MIRCLTVDKSPFHSLDPARGLECNRPLNTHRRVNERRRPVLVNPPLEAGRHSNNSCKTNKMHPATLFFTAQSLTNASRSSPQSRYSSQTVPFRDNCPDLIWHSEAFTGKSSIVKEDVSVENRQENCIPPLVRGKYPIFVFR
jgi:hypothetical protein